MEASSGGDGGMIWVILHAFDDGHEHHETLTDHGYFATEAEAEAFIADNLPEWDGYVRYISDSVSPHQA